MQQLGSKGWCLHETCCRRKGCSYPECSNSGKNGGVCTKHGSKPKKYNCSQAECNNLAQNSGICVKHGAKPKGRAKVNIYNQSKFYFEEKKYGSYSEMVSAQIEINKKVLERLGIIALI